MALTTTFVGLDEDAIGEGDSTETIVVDTWAQNRIQINNEQLLAPRVGICFSPISGSADTFTSLAGIRPYCSFHWHTFWAGYLLVYKDQTHIEFTLAYHAQIPGNTSTSNKVYVGVTCADGTNTRDDGGTVLASTYSSGVKTGHQTFTIELAERVEETGPMWVTLWSRSLSSGFIARGTAPTSTATTYHQFAFRFRDSVLTGVPGFFDPNSAGSSPDGDSLEACFVYQSSANATWPNAVAKRYDLMFTADGDAEGTWAGTLDPVLSDPAQNTNSMAMYMHYCLMLRAMFVRPVFGSIAAPVAAEAHMDRKRIQPLIEFGSGEAMEQAAAVRRAVLQPSIALIGPRGRIGDTGFVGQDLDRLASNGYAAHWPTVLGDFDPDTNSGEHWNMVREGIRLRTENPNLEVRCAWVSCQHGALWNQNQTAERDQKDRGKKEGKHDKLDIIEANGPGRATWTMAIDVSQLTDATGTGDWATDVTSYGSLSRAVSIPVYGGNVDGADPTTPPVLRGMDSVEASGKDDTNDPGFWFREGSLFGSDFQVLHTTTPFFVELSGLTETEILKPFRFNLSMTFSGFDDPVKLVDETPESDLRLTLVSCVVIEHPQEP